MQISCDTKLLYYMLLYYTALIEPTKQGFGWQYRMEDNLIWTRRRKGYVDKDRASGLSSNPYFYPSFLFFSFINISILFYHPSAQLSPIQLFLLLSILTLSLFILSFILSFVLSILTLSFFLYYLFMLCTLIFLTFILFLSYPYFIYSSLSFILSLSIHPYPLSYPLRFALLPFTFYHFTFYL